MPTKNIFYASLAALILLSGAGFISARADDNEDDAKETAALQSAKVTISEAIAAAEEKVPGGKASEVEFDIVDGTARYAVEIEMDGEQTVLVDSETGDVIKVVAGDLDDDDDDDDD